MARVFRMLKCAVTGQVANTSKEVPSPGPTHTSGLITESRTTPAKESPLDRQSSLADKLSAMLKGQ